MLIGYPFMNQDQKNESIYSGISNNEDIKNIFLQDFWKILSDISSFCSEFNIIDVILFKLSLINILISKFKLLKSLLTRFSMRLYH